MYNLIGSIQKSVTGLFESPGGSDQAGVVDAGSSLEPQSVQDAKHGQNRHDVPDSERYVNENGFNMPLIRGEDCTHPVSKQRW